MADRRPGLHAVATDRADTDPTVALRGALQTRVVKHMATITDPQRDLVIASE